MKKFLLTLCLISLAMVSIPPCLQWSGSMPDAAVVKQWMLIGTLLWFAAAPIWMKAPR
jgi:hypothetical protein